MKFEMFISLMAAGFAITSQGSDVFPVVRDGRVVAEIIRTDNARVNRDIVFFTNAVARCLGSAPQVVDRPDGPAIRFVVEKRKLLDEDRYAVTFPDARTMQITGSDHSCRWALNRILEERLGVVFCFPGPHGTHFPRGGDLVLERIPFSGDASFKIERNMYIEDLDWERSLGGKRQARDSAGMFYGHNIYNIFPVKKYGESPWREKIMPEHKGVRVKPKDPYNYWQCCYSSPECVDEAVKNICADLHKHPSNVYSITQNDLAGYCECEGCRKLNGGTFDEPCVGLAKVKSISKAFYSWANRVAAGVEKEFPDVTLGILAYGATIDPPPFRLHRNVMPFICMDLYQSREPARRACFEKLMSGWQEKAENFGMWDYAYGAIQYFPARIYTELMAEFFALKRKYPRFNGFFAEGSSFMGEGPKRWLYYRYLFNAELDRTRELTRWYEACCGKEAAPYLKAVYDEWESFWTGDELKKTEWYKSLDSTYCNFNDIGWMRALSRERLDRGMTMMRKAYDAAMRSGDAEQRVRAKRLMEFHEYYKARLVASGWNLEMTDGKLATAGQVVGFLGKIGEIGESNRILHSCIDSICAQKKAEPFPLSEYPMASFRSLSLASCGMRPQLDAVIDRRKEPVVAAAIRKAIADVRTPKAMRKVLDALSHPEDFPDRAYRNGETDVEDVAGWRDYYRGLEIDPLGGRRYRLTVQTNATWNCMIKQVKGLKPETWYLARVRLRNTSDVNSSVLAWVSVPGEVVNAGGKGLSGPIEPGKTGEAMTEVLTSSKGKDATVGFYIGVANCPGKSVVVEEVNLFEIGK